MHTIYCSYAKTINNICFVVHFNYIIITEHYIHHMCTFLLLYVFYCLHVCACFIGACEFSQSILSCCEWEYYQSMLKKPAGLEASCKYFPHPSVNTQKTLTASGHYSYSNWGAFCAFTVLHMYICVNEGILTAAAIDKHREATLVWLISRQYYNNNTTAVLNSIQVDL